MMRTSTWTPSLQLPNVAHSLRRAWQINRWLTLYALLSTSLILVGIVLAFVDTRLVTGAPVWYKPIKFALSLSINAFTLLWLLHFVQGRRRWVSLAANAVAISSLVEIAIIGDQAARGLGSHFNVATPLDATLFSIMGIFVNILWAGMLVVAVLLMLQRFQRPSFAWSLRLGLVITLAGAIVTGYMMTIPTEAQLAQAEIAGQMTVAGAHSIGATDDGPGLPFLGWSTQGGDLRPAHFLGLHAIQILAILGGLVAGWRRPWLTTRHRVSLIWIASLGYAGLVVLVMWQALRAEPLIYPSTLTLALLAGLVAAVGLGSGSVL